MRSPRPPRSAPWYQTGRRRSDQRVSTLNRWRIATFVLFLVVFIAASEMPR